LRIGIYHGYELTGSGSNEYTRYLAQTLAESGHEVHVICREPAPERISFLSEAYRWDTDGKASTLFARKNRDSVCILHQLPHAQVRPVYLTDKQREGNVKSFTSLSKSELNEYHELNVSALQSILLRSQLDILHANHLVYQPVAALEACNSIGTPFIIYPHGSSIEYVVKPDDRYKVLALDAILGCAGLITGSREVRDRIVRIYPEYRDMINAETRIVGVGVDTSLFKPVKKNERGRSIQALINTDGRGGKRPELTNELYTRLQHFEIDATRDYWDKYDHSKPDADLDTKLRRVPWNEKILLFLGALTSGKGVQSLITALPSILSRHPATYLVIVGAGAYREVLEGLCYAIATSNEPLLLELCKKGMDLDRNQLAGPWEDVQHYTNNPANLSHMMIHGKDLLDHVFFLGRLDHPRLKYLFPCADLAIFPSIIPEAYPLVLMESLSNGVLPLVSYFSGFKDGLDELGRFLGTDMVNRLKISMDPYQRIESIISNIADLLSEPDLDIYAPELRRIAVENYDWRIRGDQMVGAYSFFARRGPTGIRPKLRPGDADKEMKG
jgi:glycosyltransferase involved in cell wall biosynthesis